MYLNVECPLNFCIKGVRLLPSVRKKTKFIHKPMEAKWFNKIKKAIKYKTWQVILSLMPKEARGLRPRAFRGFRTE